MLTKWLAFGAGLATTAVGITAAAQPVVAYQVSPVMTQGKLSALAVEMRFPGTRSGVTRLTLPDNYGAGVEFWRNVRDLKVVGATSVETPDAGHRLLRGPPGSPLTVRYTIVTPYDHDPRSSETEQYQPVIRPTWFYVVGSALLGRPYDDETARVRLTWNEGASGVAAVSDLQATDAQSGAALWTLADARRSALVGGRDLRIARSGEIHVAQIGAYAFDPQAAADLSARILSAENAFWGDRPSPFLVTIVPTYAPSRLSKTWNGTGRAGGFATQITPNVELDDLAFFYAHENFHRWNSARLGGQGDDGKPGFWFSEGFTDFYALRLLVRSGAISPDRFVDLWNGILAAYASSPALAATNREIAQGFWTDPAKQKMAYQRGAMLAANWDTRLRKQTQGRVGLDDVMRAQRDAASRPGERLPAYQLFPEVAARFGLDVRGDLDRYMEHGERLELPPDAFGPCAQVSSLELPTYDRGWDIVATGAASDVVTGLRQGSAGWRAGLRNGMSLVDRQGGRPFDSSVEVTYRAKTPDGSVREYRFKPEGDGRIRVQHVTLAEIGKSPGCSSAASTF